MGNNDNNQKATEFLGSAMVDFRKKSLIISGANSVSNQATKEYLAHIWRQYKRLGI